MSDIPPGSSHADRTVSDGVRLMIARGSRSCSRERLARRSGVSARTIYEIEKRDQRPRRTTRAALAGALGVPVESIFPQAEAADGGLLPAPEARA
jgi:transcriptional regulator with XRE-family HTH domain